MRVIIVRNVQQALPVGLDILLKEGYDRDSRNGPVRIAPWPVTTIYTHPMERVLFWTSRDANPFFHLYEALWMLAGRNDVDGPARFAKQMRTYSDDGVSMHGAYGYRWRFWFSDLDGDGSCLDQLNIIAGILRQNPDDRRCVLQMWDANFDLGKQGKDFPCNTTATFQRDKDGRLDLTVFCRSNDIIWGCYGANAVHFSVLLEYMALKIGCPVGVYRQVSVNWHAYHETLTPLADLPAKALDPLVSAPEVTWCPYRSGYVNSSPLGQDADRVDELIAALLEDVDTGFANRDEGPSFYEPFFYAAYHLLAAHWLHKRGSTYAAEDRLFMAQSKFCGHRNDWLQAGLEWIQRRLRKHPVQA